MTTKRPLQNVRQAAFVGLRSSMTLEEIDCERRGFRLTKTILGTGAYAKVKLAYVMETKLEKDQRLAEDLNEKGHNMVAIKLVCKKKAPQEYLTKFMPREIDSLNATCRHRNVIQLYETFHTDSKIYLVMEYASRGDLLEYINSRSRRGIGVGEQMAQHLFRQLAEGVAHCHRRNVVHRDLKCENILLDQDSILKVSDFGFATRYPTNKCKLLSTFCGSYAYAAPEILQAQKYDGKSADVWSMGIILYAMICGRLPFNDNSLHSLIQQTKGKLTFPPKSSCPLECQHLIRQALTCDPRKRITMSEVLAHPWLVSGVDKVLAVDASLKVDIKHVTNFIQKEIAESRDEKKVTLQETQGATKEVAPTATTRIPVPKQGWASTGTTPEPHTVPKLLHRKDLRLPSKSPALESVRGDSPAISDVSRDTTPCPRSFTPTSQPKMPQKRELAVKLAQILTETGFQARPTNLSRETYVVMNKALQSAQRSGQARNDMRNSTQRVWKYVANFSSSGRSSATPLAADVTSSTKSKDQCPPAANLPPVPLGPNLPAQEKTAKAVLPWRQVNSLYSKPQTGHQARETQPSKATAPVQTKKIAGQESAVKRQQTKPQPTRKPTHSYRPVMLNLALQRPNTGKPHTIPSSPATQKTARYPKPKPPETAFRAGKQNRFSGAKNKRESPNVYLRSSNLKTAMRRCSATNARVCERKHVHFEYGRQDT